MKAGMVMCALLVAAPVAAQDLASRIAASRTERVTFTYEGREGVCGTGDNINFGNVRRNWNGDQNCIEGPIRVTLTMADRRVTRLRTTVGTSAPAGAADLGQVSPAEASDWLLDLAGRGVGEPSEQAIFPAVMAEGVVTWPRLVELAKRQGLREGTRRQAIFWLGQEAADQAVGPLTDVVEDDPDREVRKAALFALSQQRTDRSIEVLIRTARTHRDPETRRHAFFWLGQSEDPRGIALFEEVLAGR
jgi:hypothetical protein